MKRFSYIPLLPITAAFFFLGFITFCKANAIISIIGGPDFSLSSGMSTITLKLKKGEKTWEVKASSEGTLKPIENPDGTTQTYSLNENRSLLVMNTRPATQVNKIVVVLARSGDDLVVIHDVGEKAALCLKEEGYDVSGERIYAQKALSDGLLLCYMPDTPKVKGFNFIFHFKNMGFSVLKSEIKPLP